METPDYLTVMDERDIAGDDIARWLREATRGLCNDAKERVAREIRTHVADSVDDGLGLGLTRDEAMAVALTGLGSASAARRRYRRVYLTIFDEQRLRDLGRFAADPKRRQMLGVCLLILIVLSAWTLGQRVPVFSLAYAAWFLPTMIALGWMLDLRWRRIPKLHARGQVGKASALYCLDDMLQFILLFSSVFGMRLLWRVFGSIRTFTSVDMLDTVLASLYALFLLIFGVAELARIANLPRKLGGKGPTDPAGLA